MKACFVIFFLLISVVARGQDSEVMRDAATLNEQGPALQSLLRRHREGQVDKDFTVKVLRGAQALEAQGLPAEPYLLKANEGLAKQVPPRRIAPALQVSEERTRRAASLADTAMQEGARADSVSRRRAILQLDSALRGGSSPSELKSRMKQGLVGKDRPNLLDLTEGVVLPRGKGRKKSPVLPAMENRGGSEKPNKAYGPKEPKAKQKNHALEKEKKPVKSELRKPKGPGSGSNKGNTHKNKGPKGGSGKKK